MSLSADLEIGWEEEFGLGDHESRLKSLTKLVPNSREYFYFNLLYLIQTAEIVSTPESSTPSIKFQSLPHVELGFTDLLAAFYKTFPYAAQISSTVSTPSLSAGDIELRYLFLQYRVLAGSTETSQLTTITNRIAKLCNIDLTLPELPQSQFFPTQDRLLTSAIPSTLDPALLTIDRWNPSSAVDQLSSSYLLEFVLRHPSLIREQFSLAQQRELIESFPKDPPFCPDLLVELIITAFNTPEQSSRRGDTRAPLATATLRPLFAKMSRAQLDRLRAETTAKNLANDEVFFGAYLKKLHPPTLPAVTTELSAAEQQSMLNYLNKLLDFLQESSPKFISVKAIVVYHLLALHRKIGSHLAADTMALFTDHWINLPRSQSGSNSFWKAQVVTPQTIDRQMNAAPRMQQPPMQQFNDLFEDRAPRRRPASSRRNVGMEDDNEFLAFGSNANFSDPFSTNNTSNAFNPTPRQTISFSVNTELIPVGLTSFSSADEAQMTRAYLFDYFFDQASGLQEPPAAWIEYLQDTLLQGVRAEAYLLAGKGDPTAWIEQLNPDQSIRTLKDTTIIEFDEANPRHFLPDEPVTLKVWLKNVGKVVIKVFEINTDNWYRTSRVEIDTTISLDGLVAPNEFVHDFSARPPLHRCQHTFDLTAIPNKRGVFVVEIIGSGKSSRALIRKGQLHFRERLTVAGHAISVLDEQFAPVADVKILLPPTQTFQRSSVPSVHLQPDEILIPYLPATESARAQPILIQTPGFTSFGRIHHRAESFSMSAGIFVNREQLLPSRKADVLVRPRLYAAGGYTTAPLTMIHTASLLVRATDRDNIPSLLELPLDIKALVADGTASTSFTAPPGLSSLTLTLQVSLLPPRAAVLTESLEDEEEPSGDASEVAVTPITLSDALTLNLNAARLQSSIFQPYFLPEGPQQTRLMVLGRTGEPLSSQPVSVTLQHKWFRNARTFQLATAADGAVQLGVLDPSCYSSISCTHNNKTFTLPLLPHQCFTWPRFIHLMEHDPSAHELRLPSFSGVHALVCSDPDSDVLLQDLTPLLRHDPLTAAVSLSLSDLVAGVESPTLLAATFKLFILGCAHPIQIRLHRLDHLLDPTPGDLAPSFIARVGEAPLSDVKDDGAASGRRLRITVVNPSAATRLHIATSALVPPFNLYEQLARPATISPSSMRPARKASSYINGRELSDEIRYINNRKYLPIYPGVFPSVAPPTLLTNPFVHATTSESQGMASAGNQYAASGGTAEQQTQRSSAQLSSQQTLVDADCLDFLSSEGLLVANLELPKATDGVQRVVDLYFALPEQFNTAAATHFQIVLTQGDHLSSYTFTLPPGPKATQLLQCHNLCLTDAQALAANKHFIETFKCELLPPSSTFEAAKSSSGHNLEYFDSLSKVFTFFMAISNDRTRLKEFQFLLEWNDLALPKKIDYYTKFACHELNFFLFKKDPDFFASFVQPHLQHRLVSSQTLIDAYLLGTLGQDSHYGAPAVFDRLNPFERILLAQQYGMLSSYLLNLTDLVHNGKDVQLERARFLTVLAIHRMDPNRMDSFSDSTPASTRTRGLLSPANSSASFSRRRMARRTSMCLADDDDFASSMVSVKKEKTRYASESDDSSDDSSSNEYQESRFVAKKIAVKGKMASHKAPAPPAPSVLNVALEMAESRYYKSKEVFNPQLVSANQFWLDYARHLQTQASQAASSSSTPTASLNPASTLPFLSTHIHHIGTGLSELLLALAVLDLPFASAATPPILKHHADGNMAEIQSTATPLILFQKAITPQDLTADGSWSSKPHLMISQNIIDPQDPTFINEDGERVDKVLLPTDQLLPHRLYTIRIVVLNMAGTSQQLDLLYQIPVGAIAVGETKTTNSTFLELGPYSTKSFEMLVYFPKEGTYNQFPAHIFKRELLLGYAQTADIMVVSKPTVVERTWEVIVSDKDNDEEVLAFMKKSSLSVLNLRLLEPRLARSASFHTAVVNLLRQHFYFNPSIWKYAFMHGNLPLMIELLDSFSFPSVHAALAAAGYSKLESFSSPFEYDNLLNSRTHEFGAHRKLLNDAFRNTYLRFLVHCCNRATLSAEDHLRAAYYLVLMDRFAEALTHMSNAEARLDASTFGNPPEDNALLGWFRCYVALRLNQIPKAAAIAQQHADTCLIPRLRTRFESVLAQTLLIDKLGSSASSPADIAAALLGGLEAGPMDVRASQISGQDRHPALSFKISPNHESLQVSYQNITDPLSINYYSMDVELLFSTKPFLAETTDTTKPSSNFQYIQPTFSQPLVLDPAVTQVTIPIPPRFLHSNLMIELSANGLVITESLYAHSLDVHILASKGALCVFSQETRQPLSGVYVKVYSRNGSVGDGTFYKDGYTDFAGRFDYAHLNSSKLDSIFEFSILLISSDHGAVIHRTLAPSHSRQKRHRS